MYPFERFTERAKKSLTLAQQEAERAHHSYIGTEHLLLGLLREGEGLGARVLNNLGVELDAVRSAIESELGRNERIIIQQIVPTSRVKKVIEISFEEARRMGNNYVGTEHLLLGLLIEGEGIAAHVLEDLGANLERVRAEIDRLLQESRPEEGETRGGARARSPRAWGPEWAPPGAAEGGSAAPGSSVDRIAQAAERLAAEQHTSVGVEHALLAALDEDPLIRRMLAVLGVDEEKLAELRRIATPPGHLVEMRRIYRERAAEWGSGRELLRLRRELEEAERRWRAGEDVEPKGGDG